MWLCSTDSSFYGFRIDRSLDAMNNFVADGPPRHTLLTEYCLRILQNLLYARLRIHCSTIKRSIIRTKVQHTFLQYCCVKRGQKFQWSMHIAISLRSMPMVRGKIPKSNNEIRYPQRIEFVFRNEESQLPRRSLQSTSVTSCISPTPGRTNCAHIVDIRPDASNSNLVSGYTIQ